MTIPLLSSLSREGLSAHSHTPTRHRFTAQFDGRVPYSAYPGAESGAGAHLPSVMTESPFAPSRHYLLGRRVPASWTSVTRSSSPLRAHAPDL